MSVLRKTYLISALMGFLSGCSTVPNKPVASAVIVGQPLVNQIVIDSHVVHIRDLSDPCDKNTAQWDPPAVAIKTELTSLSADYANVCAEEHKRIQTLNSLPKTNFVIRFEPRSHRFNHTDNASVIDQLAEWSELGVHFWISGAAGGRGIGPESLAQARASSVEERLISVGVPETRIHTLDYDPTLPGMRALVRMTADGVVSP